ncbi:hypothetical protein F2Q70_00042132 [Brassica cretica]|uniref:Uncharacterized protein n=1 Tax=Brassica cretica TaxID=69181 RepID=A0A8S9MQK5_BRACR|nr:hypothetical protein F2Q70_00042132 [Brassica cretica]KAF2619363.1 hypothetical protein F2Q68_00042802 [Brassica cretica]
MTEDVFPLVVHSSSSVLPNVSRVVGSIVNLSLTVMCLRDSISCLQEMTRKDVLGTEIYDKVVNVLKMFWDEDEKKQNIVDAQIFRAGLSSRNLTSGWCEDNRHISMISARTC